MPEPRYLTRQQLVEFAKRELSIPLSKSKLDKDRMALNDPRPDKFYGRKELFTEETAKRYVLNLVTDKPTKLLPENKTEAA